MSTDAINSITPIPIRPQGSMWSSEKIYTDSGADVNLKNSVCNMIPAAISLNIQVTIVLCLFIIKYCRVALFCVRAILLLLFYNRPLTVRFLDQGGLILEPGLFHLHIVIKIQLVVYNSP